MPRAFRHREWGWYHHGVQNPCGGLGWQTLPDGSIEIEGRGVELPAQSGQYSLRTYVENSYRNFSGEIAAASKKRGVPENWILALIATETGILSSSRERQLMFKNFCCAGPMAVMYTPWPNYRTFGGYSSPDALFDAEKSIDAGTAMIRYHMDRGLDLPAIAALYNSGSLCCRNSPDVASKPGGRVQNEFNLCSADIAGSSYPEVAIQANNVAVLELGVGRPIKAGMGPKLLAAGGIFLLGVVLWKRRRAA